ncbi:telomere repeats-binding bouquet formation protein 2 [Arapaima gigas]
MVHIFQSVDYAEDRVTIFHSSYLLACAKGQERTSVAIGHYVLPPACVQEEVKAAVGSFIWEQEEHQKPVQVVVPEEHGMETPRRDPFPCCNIQHYPVNNMMTGYVSVYELRRYSGELHDFLPGHFGFSVTKAPNEN